MPIDPSIPLSAVARAPSEPFNPLVTLQQVAQIAALRSAQENRAEDAAARAEDQAFQREERTRAQARREQIERAYVGGIKTGANGELEVDYGYLTQHLPGDLIPGVVAQLKTDKQSALTIQTLEAQLADKRRAHRREAADTIYAAKGDPIIAGVEFRGAHALGALSEEELEQALGLETPEQILAAVGPYRTRLPERAPVPVQTVGAGGAPETRFVPPEAGVSYPTPAPVRPPVLVETMGPRGPEKRFVTPEVGAAYPSPPPERAPRAPEDLVQVAGPNGQAIWVKKSEAAGQPAAQAARGATGAERTALSYYNRMKQAVETLTTPDTSGTALEDRIGGSYASQARLRLPNLAQSTEGQAYTQAQRAFTEARLRKESGAAIPVHEYENDAKTYFVQPGDSAAVIAQKKAARERLLNGVAFSAGRAYEEYYGEPAPKAGEARKTGAAGTAGRADPLGIR